LIGNNLIVNRLIGNHLIGNHLIHIILRSRTNLFLLPVNMEHPLEALTYSDGCSLFFIALVVLTLAFFSCVKSGFGDVHA